MKQRGSDEPQATAYGQLYKTLAQIAVTAPDTATAFRQATAAFATWQATLPAQTVAGLTTVTNESSRGRFVRTLVGEFRKPWMSYFLGYDPTANLQRVRCPLLALNGEKDFQVDARLNLAAIQTATNGHNARVQTRMLPGLNHLFQHCQACTLPEYGQLTETFAPEALELMGDWLLTEALR